MENITELETSRLTKTKTGKASDSRGQARHDALEDRQCVRSNAMDSDTWHQYLQMVRPAAPSVLATYRD